MHLELSDDQIHSLACFNQAFRERQIELHHTGEWVAIDTLFVGARKGVGKVYRQIVPNCSRRYA